MIFSWWNNLFLILDKTFGHVPETLTLTINLNNIECSWLNKPIIANVITKVICTNLVGTSVDIIVTSTYCWLYCHNEQYANLHKITKHKRSPGAILYIKSCPLCNFEVWKHCSRRIRTGKSVIKTHKCWTTKPGPTQAALLHYMKSSTFGTTINKMKGGPLKWHVT